jgi:RyR domain
MAGSAAAREGFMTDKSAHATDRNVNLFVEPPRKRRWLSTLVRAASQGDITLPVVLGALAVVFGLAGWTAALFDGSFKSIGEIILRVIGSFIPKARPATDGNWASQLGAVLAALTTVIGAVMVGLATLGEHVTKAKARHLWSRHTILIGDTSLARRLAEGFQAYGQRVLHVVPIDAPKTGEPGRIRLGFDIGAILDATALRRARLVVVDLGSDAATLSLGRSILTVCETLPSRPSIFSWPLRRPMRGPVSLALRVADSVLADQFCEVIFSERRRQRSSGGIAALRPAIFDENRVIARYTLARNPLFVMAHERKQARVHAVVIGFGDLGEKLHDQIMLTSIAGSLDLPRVTVLDRQAARRQREFRARRPAVLDGLATEFVEFDIGLDLLEGAEASPQTAKLLAPENSLGITAIFLALPTDAENLRAALLLRRHGERNGGLNVPIFYRSRLSPGEGDVLGAADNLEPSGCFIPMRISFEALLGEIANADGRDALARALHENYLRGAGKSIEAATAWEELSEPLRRANIRAADHLPAKLWSLGFDISGLLPGRIPAFDPAAKQRLFGEAGASPPPDTLADIATLTKLEHERWMVERKLDGWTYGPVRDDKRQRHPKLISWEELLKKSPADVTKDTEQIWAILRLVSERGKAPVLSLDVPKAQP